LFFLEKKQPIMNAKYGQFTGISLYNGEFRAKVEKKSERFWQIDAEYIVLVIDLGYN
jgi:hypothetical protein